MKKITITLLLLVSLNTFSQTVLFNYDGVGTDFQFCFDAPDPDECTSTIETNNDTTGDNTSATYWQSVAPTVGAAFNYGLGAQFSPPTAPTINNDGNFLTIAFRADNNPTGVLNITAQLWANDNDKIDGFSAYTKTDGSWQIIEFDYSGSMPQGVFNNDTGISRVNFFIDEGAANGYTYGVDEVTMNSASLSVNDFLRENISIWPNPVNESINIQGQVLRGSIQIFDVLGNLISEKSYTKNNNSLDVSNLSKGVYFLTLENGSTFKFVKK